jgi:hypothetical protein
VTTLTELPAVVARIIAAGIALAIGLGAPAPPPPVDVPVVRTAAERDQSGGERVRRIPAPERRAGGGTPSPSGTVDRMQDGTRTGATTSGGTRSGGTAPGTNGTGSARGDQDRRPTPAGGTATGGAGTGGTATGGASGNRGGASSGGSPATSGGTGSGRAGGGGTVASTGDGVTAAATLGWGTPERSDDFSNGLGGWNLYDGPGHAGNGRRTPSAASVSGGILTIRGDSSGNTAGMAWMPGRKYGRWEGRVRAPASDPSYNALLLLWPDAENFPVGGEVDFMEMMDHTRQRTNLFLHYGASNSQVSGEVAVDATQWHNWAVEWTPQGLTAYVDGEAWFHTSDTSILPPGPMHLCIQLDWFPKGGGVRESRMEVDWVRQYAL